MEPDFTPSTLDSVWAALKLPGNHPLSQLRDKFWNYSVEQEQIEWRRNHPEGETMKVDQDDESIASEIGPGSYPLDLGIKGLEQSKLWIRQDYIRIYNYCQQFYDKLGGDDLPPSVVITGQPGIGKTYWIRYALRRRLGEGNVIIWCGGAGRYLFAEDGVFEVPSNHKNTDFKRRVWTLADSDGCDPRALTHHGSNLFLMYTTSPRRKRWAPLAKTTRLITLVMNPWTREELFHAAPLHGLTDFNDRALINDLYNRLGPTAHQLRHFISEGCGRLNMDAVSHQIFLVKRTNVDDLLDWSVEPIATSVESALQRRIREWQRGEQLHLYQYLAAVQESRRTAGLLFESLAQSKLQERVELELFPMVKRTSSGSTGSGEGNKGKKIPRWHSNHNMKADSSSQSDRHCVDFTPTKTIEYRGSELEDIQPGIFYVPELTNQVVFHSFILANGYFYIFQFFIASDPSIKPGIPFFLQPSLPPKMMWHFVFIIPPGSEISCPQPRDTGLDELKLFTAELDPCN
ncbi:hypothetical protein BJV78DRAFT_1239036 [Lactifluus subvellereus]|nr:hypothetical protein BJV78DRAFT_1239036 [Lactifluus subvellereus]